MTRMSREMESHDKESSPPAQKRQRAKQACEPCRLRKRRCDGNLPCNMCTQFEYKCYFEKHPRKRSKIVEQHAHQDGVNGGSELVKSEGPAEGRPTYEEINKMRTMEANSGIAFTRLLGMRLDPSSGPKLFTFGWNLGNSTHVILNSPPITDFLDQAQMHALAMLYIENVHPLYGFLDKDWILQNVARRWTLRDECTMPDHLFCGIAAIGTLFSDGTLCHVLPRIVDSQKQTLENVAIMQPPCLTDVQSFLLRTLYLRCTDHPHAVWMASCATMHLVESVGLQLEASSSVLHPAAVNGSQNVEIRRRTFWIARMLNSWVSFEYGRTRVALRGITTKLPTPRENDFTCDYINLYGISCCLDPEQTDKAGQWEDFLSQLDAYEPRHDGIALSKANLALCGYRRLRLANPNLGSDVINKIINMGLKGLEAAKRMAERSLPWWHVANVPFQVICVFLAMDIRESLSHLGTAMRTFEVIVDRFHTVAMKEALKTARFLIRLSKKRKDEDSEALAQSLRKGIAEPDPHPDNMAVATPYISDYHPTPAAHTPMTQTSSEDWNLDVLNSSDFDWNFFLTVDMPAFSAFAPDGTM